MMKRLLSRDAPAPLDRRAIDRELSNGRGFWMRRLQPTEILAAVTLAGLLMVILGLSRYSPGVLDNRIGKLEHRVDSLASSLKFTNYLQCVQLKRADPVAAPPECGPLVDSRGRP